MVTSAGFNALLKVVEEPPEHLKFIFATTEPEKVIGTIRSRTHHYPFRLVPPGTLRDHLSAVCEREAIQVEDGVYPLVVRAGAGSVRDSMSVMDQLLAGADADGVTYAMATALLGYTDAALLDDVVDGFAAGDGAAVFEIVDRVVEGGHDPRRFVADLLERLRDLVIIAAVPDAVEKGLVDAPKDVVERMRAQASVFGGGRAEPRRRPGQHRADGDARRDLAPSPAGADLRPCAAAGRVRRRALDAGPAGAAGARSESRRRLRERGSRGRGPGEPRGRGRRFVRGGRRHARGSGRTRRRTSGSGTSGGGRGRPGSPGRPERLRHGSGRGFPYGPGPGAGSTAEPGSEPGPGPAPEPRPGTPAVGRSGPRTRTARLDRAAVAGRPPGVPPDRAARCRARTSRRVAGGGPGGYGPCPAPGGAPPGRVADGGSSGYGHPARADPGRPDREPGERTGRPGSVGRAGRPACVPSPQRPRRRRHPRPPGVAPDRGRGQAPPPDVDAAAQQRPGRRFRRRDAPDRLRQPRRPQHLRQRRQRGSAEAGDRRGLRRQVADRDDGRPGRRRWRRRRGSGRRPWRPVPTPGQGPASGGFGGQGAPGGPAGGAGGPSQPGGQPPHGSAPAEGGQPRVPTRPAAGAAPRAARPYRPRPPPPPARP